MVSKLGKTVVGAMLFGGTLGPAFAASAGVTIGNFEVTDAYVSLDVNNAGFWAPDLASALAGGMAYDSAVSGRSVTLSAFTASGFSLSTTPVDGTWTVYGCVFTFTALSNVTIELSGQMDAQSAFVYLIDNASSSVPFLRGTGDLGAWTSGGINLVAGRSYTVGVNGPGAIANGSGEAGSILSFAVVPAPGAVALLGAAGLVGSRRRR